MLRTYAVCGAVSVAMLACNGEGVLDHASESDAAALAPAAKKTGSSGKVDICHTTGNGKYVKIRVSDNALPAHLDHGDGVAGGDGFDESCEPQCPCWTAEEIGAVDWDSYYDYSGQPDYEPGQVVVLFDFDVTPTFSNGVSASAGTDLNGVHFCRSTLNGIGLEITEGEAQGCKAILTDAASECCL